ncbi:MAG TPA: DUF2934 domain-containing protein [Opitutaceae bacterium]|nr:DUF2934 domain-containing protein [Opitutaceae bacterium]
MKTTVSDVRPEPGEAEIQKAAYFLWIELGRPEGREVETWFAAKERLRHGRAVTRVGAFRPPSSASRRILRTTVSETNP